MKEGRYYCKKNKKETKSRRYHMEKRISLGLCAALCFLIVLAFFHNMADQAAAGDLGGFQVEMGTGETTSLPSDWNKETAESREEKGYMGESDQKAFPSEWERDFYSDTQMETQQDKEMWEDHGEVKGKNRNEPQSEQALEEGISLSGEAFSDGTRMQESPASQKTEVKKVPEQIMRSEVPSTAVPKAALTAAPGKTPSPGALAAPLIKKSPKPEPLPEEKKDPASVFYIPTKIPRIVSRKIKVDFANPLYLKIAAEGELKILSVKINGKESIWNWQPDGIKVFWESEEIIKGTNIFEIILLADGASVRGIFIDGKNKPCYTIQ